MVPESDPENSADPGLSFIPLEGSELPRPRGMQDLGPVDPNRRIVFAIHLHPDLEAPASDSTPNAVDDDYLSLEDYESQYSASDHDAGVIIDYLIHVGIDQSNIHPAPVQCVIAVDANADQCNRAFQIELKNFDSRRGKFFGHDGVIHLPVELDGIVESVSGLDNLVSLSRVRADDNIADFTPFDVDADQPEQAEAEQDDMKVLVQNARTAAEEDVPTAAEEVASADLPEAPMVQMAPMLQMVQSPEPPSSSKFCGTSAQTEDYLEADRLLPPDYKLYFPSDIARLYDFPEQYDGQGETIGIISMNGRYDPSDVQRYFQAQGITPPTIHVEKIGPCRDSATRSVHDLELTMDLQVAGSVAPGARLVVFRVAADMPQPYLTALKFAIHSKYRPSIISISYGCAEGLFRKLDLQNSNRFFESVTKMGITICAASGDAGSASRDYDSMPPPPGPHVNFPASSPFVLACGGTAMETADDRIVREFAWNDHHQCRLATAGGISSVFSRPEYQKDLKLPKAPGDRGEFDGRGLPDVAANASLTSGYRVLFGGHWIPNGGTSAATPIWCGLIARLNQALGKRLGFINPLLYKLAGTPALRDICEGSNGFYKANQGWDACTGNGVPVGQALLDALRTELGIERIDPVDPGDGSARPGDQTGNPGDLSSNLPTSNVLQLQSAVDAAQSAAITARQAANAAMAATGRLSKFRLR